MTDDAVLTDSMQSYDMPARKAILQYLVRMGSFTSAPKVPNEDLADENVEFPTTSTWKELLERCEKEYEGWPKSIPRKFTSVGPPGESIRIMQWNILAQALAEGSDNFLKCPIEALKWHPRRWRIVAEIGAMEPDILCMQEVDHFRFLEKALSSVGFVGVFYQKPDSPCLYVPGNNGPDGAAIFVNKYRYEILDIKKRCLEVLGCDTNQVAVCCKLRRLSDDAEFWVVTTHLKARSGALLEALRREQGSDLVEYLKGLAGEKTPILVTGDLNAQPSEAVHSVISAAGFESAYRNQNPSYTTWTYRESGEYCKTLDYILYRRQAFHVERVLCLPSEEDIGLTRVPSFKYPSDHFALVADMVLEE